MDFLISFFSLKKMIIAIPRSLARTLQKLDYGTLCGKHVKKCNAQQIDGKEVNRFGYSSTEEEKFPVHSIVSKFTTNSSYICIEPPASLLDTPCSSYKTARIR